MTKKRQKKARTKPGYFIQAV